MAAPVPIQRYVRIAGILMLITAIAGTLGESYIPGKIIVSTDAAATARNITSLQTMFRWGFATYLMEAICDISLAVLFYVILRPTNKTLALLAAFFGVLSTALYAVAEAFYFAPTLILSGAPYLKTFSPEQLDSLALLSLRMFSRTAGIFLVFYGVATLIRGVLIFRSVYLPRWLGALVCIAGIGFIWQSIAIVLAPGFASSLFMIPMAAAGIALMFWFLLKGVNQPAWEVATAQNPA